MTLPNPAPNPAACPDKTLQNAVAQAFPTLNQPWTRLQGGRVNAVWRAGDMVIKHYHPSGDSPLFPNDPAAEAAALSLLAPFGLAPKLLGKGQGWIAYHYCPGTAWKTNTARVADTLTRLHQTPFQTAGFRHAPNGSAALLAQAKSIAALCKQASGKPALPPPPPDPNIPPGPTCLIHGDLVPGNLIVHHGTLTPIDWQCPAIGDPVDDIATFLSPAMQFLYRGAPLTHDEIGTFRAGCPINTIQRYDQLAALYHWRMAAHCLWKVTPDYAQAMQLELAALQRLTQKNPG